MTEEKAKPTVYVVEQQPFDYSPASAFGILKFMDSRHRLAPMSPSLPNTWNNNVVQKLRKELADYMPGRDYVIPTGAPSRMLVAGMVLAEKGRTHRLLGWDARTQRYMEYLVTI
jgi:hypothetical protein